MDQIKKNTDNDVQANAPPARPTLWAHCQRVAGTDSGWRGLLMVYSYGGLAAGYYLSKKMKEN